MPIPTPPEGIIPAPAVLLHAPVTYHDATISVDPLGLVTAEFFFEFAHAATISMTVKIDGVCGTFVMREWRMWSNAMDEWFDVVVDMHDPTEHEIDAFDPTPPITAADRDALTALVTHYAQRITSNWREQAGDHARKHPFVEGCIPEPPVLVRAVQSMPLCIGLPLRIATGEPAPIPPAHAHLFAAHNPATPAGLFH